MKTLLLIAAACFAVATLSAQTVITNHRDEVGTNLAKSVPSLESTHKTEPRGRVHVFPWLGRNGERWRALDLGCSRTWETFGLPKAQRYAYLRPPFGTRERAFMTKNGPPVAKPQAAVETVPSDSRPAGSPIP